MCETDMHREQLMDAQVQRIELLLGGPPLQDCGSKTGGTAAFKAQSLQQHQDKRSLAAVRGLISS